MEARILTVATPEGNYLPEGVYLSGAAANKRAVEIEAKGSRTLVVASVVSTVGAVATPQQAADMLNVHPATIHTMIEAGQLTASKLSERVTRINMDSILALMP